MFIALFFRSDTITENLFNIEILIQTLQTTSNIKIQYSILFLLSAALSLFPVSLPS